MSSGLPDEFLIKGIADFKATLDVGELAIRVGSPVTYFRGGQVIWLTDFRNGLGNVQPIATGADAKVALCSDTWHFGGASVLLASGTGLNDHATLMKGFALPDTNVIGLSTLVAFGLGDEDYRHTFTHMVSGVARKFGVRFYLPDKKLYVLTEGDNWTDTGVLVPWDPYRYLYHHVKLSVRIDTFGYIGLWYDNNFLDLSDYTYYTGIGSDLPILYVSFDNYSIQDMITLAYVDSIILTYNERE